MYHHLKDINKAFEYARKSMEAAQKSGNSYIIGHSTFWLGRVHQHQQNDEDDVAFKLMKEAIEIFKKIGHNFSIGTSYGWLAVIYQKRGDWDGVIECYQRCVEIPTHPWRKGHISNLAWAYLQKGDLEKAVEYSKKALEAGISDSMHVAQNLETMEEAFIKMGKREEFIAFCQKFREEKKEEIGNLKLTQWYIEPADVGAVREPPLQTIFADEFNQPVLKSEWQWINPRGDSSYSLSTEPGWLEVRPASQSYLYRLYGTKFEAPRLLQEISGDSGDFALETKIGRGGSRTAPTSDDLPSIGGLLIWKDKENYLQFQRGERGHIRFSGMINGEFDDLGRGLLASEIVYLRLEKIDDKISAYCSEDGTNWLTCGYIGATHASPLQDPIQVGIYAIGENTETATRFDYFKVMR
jgi:tetratricopeptide (TPR) repeat protein